jgi:hypothetical protein
MGFIKRFTLDSVFTHDNTNDLQNLGTTPTLSSLKKILEVVIPIYCFESIYHNLNLYDPKNVSLFFDLYLDHSDANVEQNQPQLNDDTKLYNIFNNGNNKSVTNQMNTYVKENWISQLNLLSKSSNEEVVIGQAK